MFSYYYRIYLLLFLVLALFIYYFCHSGYGVRKRGSWNPDCLASSSPPSLSPPLCRRFSCRLHARFLSDWLQIGRGFLLGVWGFSLSCSYSCHVVSKGICWKLYVNVLYEKLHYVYITSQRN